MSGQPKIPILFMVFNRPDHTRRVFAAIRQYRPEYLLIVSDGPRAGRPTEAERVAEVRALVEAVDWPCRVATNHSSTNLGCKIRISTGISWAFDLVDELIILEDDCLPSESFFEYCHEMLSLYRGDQNVWSISGSQFSNEFNENGHYLSCYSLMWGWATWRDRWVHYRVDPKGYLRVLLKMWWKRPAVFFYWRKIFKKVANNQIDTWDYQWMLSIWKGGGMTCRPSRNLVENIGFGEEATHTKTRNKGISTKVQLDPGSTFSRFLGSASLVHKLDQCDERNWALINWKTILILYFPWLTILKSKFTRLL